MPTYIILSSIDLFFNDNYTYTTYVWCTRLYKSIAFENQYNKNLYRITIKREIMTDFCVCLCAHIDRVMKIEWEK